MDFVVAGILLGSLAVVVGELIRLLGPKRTPADRKSLRRAADPANTPRAWKNACHAIGLLIATAGAFLLLMTLLMTLIGVSDSVGWIGVALIGAIGAGVALVGSWSILNHYRSGGFDPVLIVEQAPAATLKVAQPVSQPSEAELFDDIDAAVAAGMVESAWIEVEDRDVEDAVSDSPRIEDEQSESEQPSSMAVTPANGLEPALVTSASEPVPTQQVALPERPQEPEPVLAPVAPPTRDSTIEQVSKPAAAQAPNPVPVSPNPPIQRRPTSPASTPQEPLAAPDFASPNFEFPLIDLEEDLPAWNATPTRPAPTPVSIPRSAARPIAPPDPAMAEPDNAPVQSEPSQGGFKSSLLADVGTDARKKQTGRHFSSSLLNELTSDLGPPRPADDIVLDEFSLPTDDSADKPSGATGR